MGGEWAASVQKLQVHRMSRDGKDLGRVVVYRVPTMESLNPDRFFERVDRGVD